jgi:hypothetical protein
LIPDLDILDRRVAAMTAIPWPIPSTIIMYMTDEDLDNLDAAANTDRYWAQLNRIVGRIEREAQNA